jgi:phosphoenolpyruvate carboxylase
MSASHVNYEKTMQDNIRYLGRVLGETILAKDGGQIFDVIEDIRQTEVAFHRKGGEGASQELSSLLNKLTPDETISVVRAFSYFKHLVNIAEDINSQQQATLNEDDLHPGMLAHSMSKMVQSELSFESVTKFFETALISPVLTAHPTEVQRKSILDTEQALSALLMQRATLVSKKELERNDLMIRGH